MPVQQNHAFIHVVGNNGKFFLLAAQFGKVFAQLALLLGNARQKRSQFVISIIVQRLVKVYVIQRLHKVFGQPAGDYACQHRNKNNNAQHERRHSHYRFINAVNGSCQTQNFAVLKPYGIVIGSLVQRIAEAFLLAGTVGNGFHYFLAHSVVLQRFGFGLIIKQHRAVAVNQRNAHVTGVFGSNFI